MDPVIKWAFLGVGLFGQAGAMLLARRPVALMRAGGKAQGTVTSSDAEVHSGSKGPAKTYHFPHIAFTTARGEKISFKSAVGRGVAFDKGTVLPVLYDPAHPQDAIIGTFAHVWMIPMALSLLSLPFLLVGVAGFFTG